MKILILGGSGFVGTRLTGLLINEHDVIIADIQKSESYPDLWQYCDVRQKDDLRKVMAGIDCVVNLAAAHKDDVRPLSLYTDVNVTGAENVCRVATELNVKKIVFTSSVAVYGFPEYAYDENAPMSPFNEYGKTKLLAEKVYENWQTASQENHLNVIRPTVIFGENNRGNVYNLFKQLASGRFLMIGSGKNCKSMAYVGNVTAFLKWNIEENRQNYSVYNYIDKPDYSMRTLLSEFERIMQKKLPRISFPYWIGLLGGFGFDILARITGKTFPVSSIRVKKFCAQTVFDSSKMQNSGFVPPYSMPEALEKTILYEFKTEVK